MIIAVSKFALKDAGATLPDWDLRCMVSSLARQESYQLPERLKRICKAIHG